MELKGNNDMPEDMREIDNLKTEINNLLWVYLPADTTLGEAEKMAGKIYEMIVKRRVENGIFRGKLQE